ncbi:MAG: MotA/TolQ/ExbB proton channel family protein [Proteobacteria bacterium]|nr:MotA/TolQ/ExbB proton channel family protein [Pseudomonadota bacterium]
MDFFHAFAQGNAVLIAVFVLLIAMSFVSWYIIFWKGMLLRRERLAYKKFYVEHVKIQNWPVRENLKTVDGAVNFLIAEVKNLEKVLPQYSGHEAKKEILTMHLLQVLDETRSWLDKGLTILASVGSSAPFIGLFGTVWGIYNSLQNISAQGNAGLATVAGPMGEALVATAIGLFAAIPAVLAYNTFVRLNRLLVQDLRHVAEQLTVYLSNDAK